MPKTASGFACQHAVVTDLLASIVASRHLQPEPVATDALVHLCAASTAAASVMSDLLVELCPGSTTSGLTFTGQEVSTETEGRPDLVAADAEGVRLVVEAKFDAALTSAQTGGAYLAKLKAGVPGALVFLVPQDRMRNLWLTVSVTPGGAPGPLALSDEAGKQGLVSLPLNGAGHAVAALSWESLLNRMDAAMAKVGDTAGAAELAQIRGLVTWRTRTGWVPLAPGDLPQRVARQLSGVNRVLKAVAQRVAKEASTKTSNGSADGGFGRYIKTATGKSIWMGTYLDWWDRYGPGPAWVQVRLTAPQQVAITSEALTSAGIAHHAVETWNEVLIPLVIPDGAEQGEAEQAAYTQVSAIVATLDALSVDAVEDPVEDEQDDSFIDQPG